MDNILYLLGTISIICVIASIILLGNILRSDHNYTENKQTSLTPIWPLTLLGILAAIVSGIIYFYVYNATDYFMYGLLWFVCVSFGLSLSAFSTSIISKWTP